MKCTNRAPRSVSAHLKCTHIYRKNPLLSWFIQISTRVHYRVQYIIRKFFKYHFVWNNTFHVDQTLHFTVLAKYGFYFDLLPLCLRDKFYFITLWRRQQKTSHLHSQIDLKKTETNWNYPLDNAYVYTLIPLYLLCWIYSENWYIWPPSGIMTHLLITVRNSI